MIPGRGVPLVVFDEPGQSGTDRVDADTQTDVGLREVFADDILRDAIPYTRLVDNVRFCGVMRIRTQPVLYQPRSRQRDRRQPLSTLRPVTGTGLCDLLSECLSCHSQTPTRPYLDLCVPGPSRSTSRPPPFTLVVLQQSHPVHPRKVDRPVSFHTARCRKRIHCSLPSP
jgi:hypothetical protein